MAFRPLESSFMTLQLSFDFFDFVEFTLNINLFLGKVPNVSFLRYKWNFLIFCLVLIGCYSYLFLCLCR